MGRDPETAALVGGGDEPEQELCTGVVAWREPEVVDDARIHSSEAR